MARSPGPRIVCAIHRVVEIMRLNVPHSQREPTALGGAGDMPRRYLMHSMNSMSVMRSAWESGRVLNQRVAARQAQLRSHAKLHAPLSVVTSWLASRAAQRHRATTLVTRCCIARNTLAMVSLLAGPRSSGWSSSAMLRACQASCVCCPCGPQNGCVHSGPPANALWLTAAAARYSPSATSRGVLEGRLVRPHVVRPAGRA